MSDLEEIEKFLDRGTSPREVYDYLHEMKKHTKDLIFTVRHLLEIQRRTDRQLQICEEMLNAHSGS